MFLFNDLTEGFFQVYQGEEPEDYHVEDLSNDEYYWGYYEVFAENGSEQATHDQLKEQQTKGWVFSHSVAQVALRFKFCLVNIDEIILVNEVFEGEEEKTK